MKNVRAGNNGVCSYTRITIETSALKVSVGFVAAQTLLVKISAPAVTRHPWSRSTKECTDSQSTEWKNSLYPVSQSSTCTSVSTASQFYIGLSLLCLSALARRLFNTVPLFFQRNDECPMSLERFRTLIIRKCVRPL